MPKKRLSQEEIHQKEPLILRDPERHKKWLKRKARKEQKENEEIIEKLKDEGKVRSIAGFFTVQEDNIEEDPWMQAPTFQGQNFLHPSQKATQFHPLFL